MTHITGAQGSLVSQAAAGGELCSEYMALGQQRSYLLRSRLGPCAWRCCLDGDVDDSSSAAGRGDEGLVHNAPRWASGTEGGYGAGRGAVAWSAGRGCYS